MYCRKIVLDFDGTICMLFANYGLEATAARVGALMKQYGVSFPTDADPFDAFGLVLDSALETHEKERLLTLVDSLISEAEGEALDSSVTVAGFDEFLKLVRDKRISLGIASNNSEKCIKEFLRKYPFASDIPVVGRDPLHPEFMKPHTHVLEKICNKMDSSCGDIVFVGDNIRDYECAEKFGAAFIALTPTERKYRRMVEKGLDVSKIKVARDFYELIDIMKLGV